ncbi:unnamed protein product [Mytilus edulis]|uniref:Uncharacterized protein n=1 Tax=Mytilus edulis TaxID=6550 RepID=A0A8S3Q9E7_MYTED|nr:unnamed protein product [Mytilus edulis]
MILLKSRNQLTESEMKSKRVLDMQIGNLQSKISDIEQDSNKYQSNVNLVIHAIREEGKHLKEQIDMNVESLVRSVKQKETKNLETLRSIENEIKTALNKAKEQQKIYQDTQGMKDTTKLIQQLKQINSQICLIDEKPILAMPFVKYSGKKVPGSEIKNLFGDLTFGYVCFSYLFLYSYSRYIVDRSGMFGLVIFICIISHNKYNFVIAMLLDSNFGIPSQSNVL